MTSIQAPFPRKPAAVIPRGGKDGQEPTKPVPLEVNSMVTMQTQSLRPFHATLGELARSPSPPTGAPPSPPTGAPPSHPLSIISSSPPSASLSLTPIDFSSLAGSPLASYTPPILIESAHVS